MASHVTAQELGVFRQRQKPAAHISGQRPAAAIYSALTPPGPAGLPPSPTCHGTAWQHRGCPQKMFFLLPVVHTGNISQVFLQRALPSTSLQPCRLSENSPEIFAIREQPPRRLPGPHAQPEQLLRGVGEPSAPLFSKPWGSISPKAPPPTEARLHGAVSASSSASQTGGERGRLCLEGDICLGGTFVH